MKMKKLRQKQKTRNKLLMAFCLLKRGEELAKRMFENEGRAKALLETARAYTELGLYKKAEECTELIFDPELRFLAKFDVISNMKPSDDQEFITMTDEVIDYYKKEYTTPRDSNHKWVQMGRNFEHSHFLSQYLTGLKHTDAHSAHENMLHSLLSTDTASFEGQFSKNFFESSMDILIDLAKTFYQQEEL